jgi:polyisoprenoid-binding protein YceI
MSRLMMLTYTVGALVLLAATPAGNRVIPIDTERSKMTVFVYKEGLFAFAADNHQVNVPIASGSFDENTKAVDLKVDTGSMQVQDPPSRHDKVQANMDGPAVLDIAKYPEIAFHSTNITLNDPDHWTVTGDLTLHGQTRSVVLQVVTKDASSFTGSTTVRQTDFGIAPIRIAGGAVRVKDEVKVEFEIFLAQRAL